MKTPPAPRGRACRPALGLALACLALALAAPPRAAAQATFNPPERLTYQGFLTDGNGVALGSTAPKNYDVVFRIYNSENQSQPVNLLWAEQQTVTVDKGYFSVLLGEGAAVGSEPRPALSTLFKGATASDRWVGITVKGIGAGGANVDILPRLRLLSSPYAFLAQQANRLVQDNGNDLISASGAAVTVSGSLQVLNALTAASFSGDGAGLAGVAKLNGGNTFNGNQFFNNAVNVGNFGGADQALTIATAGGNLYRSSLNLRHFNNNFGWTIQSDETDSKLKFLSHFNAAAGTSRLELDRFSGRADFRGSVGIANANVIEFGAGFTKEASAGQIGYGTHSGGASGSLDIVGAGTTASKRQVKIWSEGRMQVVGGVDVGGGIFARGGYPGGGGVNNSGYAFTGNGGDNDSGMFSDLDGHVRLVSNSQLRMSVYPSGAYVHSGGLYVDSFNGTRTFDVEGDYIKVYNASDKNKNFIMFRYGSGVAIRGFGGGWGNASGWERTITWDGDGNWDASSDRRLKKDIVDAEPMLDRALKVQIRRFRWKDAPDDSKLSLGVVAQELEPLFPELVSVQEGPASAIDDEKTLAVGYSDFGMIAIKALQELKAQHDEEVGQLKSEVAELRGQMAAMQKQVAAMLRANAELRDRLEQETLTASARR